MFFSMRYKNTNFKNKLLVIINTKESRRPLGSQWLNDLQTGVCTSGYEIHTIPSCGAVCTHQTLVQFIQCRYPDFSTGTWEVSWLPATGADPACHTCHSTASPVVSQQLCLLPVLASLLLGSLEGKVLLGGFNILEFILCSVFIFKTR